MCLIFCESERKSSAMSTIQCSNKKKNVAWTRSQPIGRREPRDRRDALYEYERLSASVWMPVVNYDLRRVGCVLFIFRFHLVRSRPSVGVRRVRASDAQTGTAKRSLKTESYWKLLLVSTSSTSSPLAARSVTTGPRAPHDIGDTTEPTLGVTMAVDHDYYDGFRTFSWLADLVGLPIDQVRRERRLRERSGRPHTRRCRCPPADSWVITGVISILPSCLSPLYILRKRIKNSYLIDLYWNATHLSIVVAPRSCFQSDNLHGNEMRIKNE